MIEYKKTGEKDIGFKWSGNNLMYSSTGSSGTTLTLKGDSSLSLVFQGSKFSLSAFLGYLEKTGEVRVLKNILFSVKNGKEATVEDTTLYPYVKQIGITTVGTQQNTATAQTVDFGESKSGFILKVVPKYYPLSNLLDLKVELNKEKVLSYITVKSGEYEVERPIVDTKILTSEFLEKPDSVFVMGGIINRESSRELITPFGIKKLGNRKEKTEYSYLFVVIIPEVIRYETCP
ncbi:hypothetical protein [Desulfurobacterium sp.]|uniref:hypothetical protein n=1 Tax=Desulfurobacterium sp. TaxID=2004706 RepID=UPI00262D65C0|nr:hypothetical protein [Desulfurobacterium sp.]